MNTEINPNYTYMFSPYRAANTHSINYTLFVIHVFLHHRIWRHRNVALLLLLLLLLLLVVVVVAVVVVVVVAVFLLLPYILHSVQGTYFTLFLHTRFQGIKVFSFAQWHSELQSSVS